MAQRVVVSNESFDEGKFGSAHELHRLQIGPELTVSGEAPRTLSAFSGTWLTSFWAGSRVMGAFCGSVGSKLLTSSPPPALSGLSFCLQRQVNVFLVCRNGTSHRCRTPRMARRHSLLAAAPAEEGQVG